MTRFGRLFVGSSAILLAGSSLATSVDARGRLGIHPSFGAHGGGIRAGGQATRPGAGGAGTRQTFNPPSHQGMVGWDQASRGPPRPGPGPGPRPPGPGPHPYPPPPPPPPPPAWGWGPYWNDWNWGDDVAAGVIAGAAIGTAAAVASTPTTVVVGTVVTALPGNCIAVLRNGITYEQCGPVWYKPQYLGTAIQYVVVTPP